MQQQYDQNMVNNTDDNDPTLSKTVKRKSTSFHGKSYHARTTR